MLMRWYHSCGYPLKVAIKDCGQQQFTKFYEAKDTSPLQRVRNCPSCQKPLGSLDLPSPVVNEQP
jgi:hypothetical protein